MEEVTRDDLDSPPNYDPRALSGTHGRVATFVQLP
jgi:hypothetical protein